MPTECDMTPHHSLPGRSGLRERDTTRCGSPEHPGIGEPAGPADRGRPDGPLAPATGTASPAGGSPAATLVAALLGFFLLTLDASVVNVALPAMGRGLHGGLSALQWVVDGYTLALAALMLSTGALADRVGAARAFRGGAAVFTAASLACGLAPDLTALVAARVVQGAAAAAVLPSSLALVRQAFPERARQARAISVWATGGSIAVALGPVAGGALTSLWGWRAVFLVNLPAGVAALLLSGRARRSPRRPAPLDLPGQAAAVVALAALAYAVVEGGRAGWAAGAGAAAAFAVFLVLEARRPHPVVPLGLFRAPAVTASVLAGSAVSFAFVGMVFVLSLFFQQVRGLSPMGAGVMFVPMTVLISTVNVVSGRLTNRFGPRLPMLLGQGVAAAGLLVLLPVGAGGPLPLVALAAVPFALGAALAVPALTAAMMAGAPGERAGMAAGVLNAARQVSGALSVAVFGSLIGGGGHDGHGGFLAGMRVSALAGAALLAVSAAVTALALRGPGAVARRVGGPAGADGPGAPEEARGGEAGQAGEVSGSTGHAGPAGPAGTARDEDSEGAE
jgi:DHA2 family methylenomycin A resistance protein-like MFS transporter